MFVSTWVALSTLLSTPALPVGKGSDFSDRWLIILSSNKELGVQPKAVDQLAIAGVETKIAVLSSTEFKALMPCYEIVTAHSFTGRKAAVAYSRKLTKLGIDNYPRFAGKWVGAQPRVEAYCRGDREPVEFDECPSKLGFVERVDARTFVRLRVDPIVENRVIDAAGAPRRLDRGSWIAPLGAHKIEGVEVGDAYSVIDGSGRNTACKVEAFAVLTLGEPHFGSADATTPTCGSAALFAELDCASDRAILAIRGTSTPSRFVRQPASNEDIVRGRKALDASEAHTAIRKRAEGEAKAQGEALKAKLTPTVFVLGSRRLLTLQLDYTTRDGRDMCGADDVNVRVIGLVDVSAEAPVVLRAFSQVTGEVVDVLDIGGKVTLSLKAWPDRRWLEQAGKTVCEIENAYCDCPC